MVSLLDGQVQNLSFSSQASRLHAPGEQWAQRTVHCAASPQDAQKKGDHGWCETRNHRTRTRHALAVCSTCRQAASNNDPQGRGWVCWDRLVNSSRRAKVIPVRACMQMQPRAAKRPMPSCGASLQLRYREVYVGATGNRAATALTFTATIEQHRCSEGRKDARGDCARHSIVSAALRAQS